MTKTLHIDPELQTWLEPLSPTELARLEASLLEEGCRDPLVVWNDCLLDGHNRYALCTKHGIAFETVEKTGLVTKEDAMLWMIENQLGKRNLTDFARVQLAFKLKPLAEERARARMLAGQANPRQNSDEGPVRTDEVIARAAGVSRDTVRKVEKIVQDAAPDVIAQVRAGELSINAAAKMVMTPKATAKPTDPKRSNSGRLDAATETAIATTRLPPEPAEAAITCVDALLAENAQLRGQLGDLAAQFGEAMDCHDEIRAILEASVPAEEAPLQLQRALELALTFESRVAEAPRHHADAQCKQDDVMNLTN